MSNPERISIKDITLEEPKKESKLPFDPEREITEEKWMIITRMLENLKQENDWWKFSREVTSIKLLFPDKASKIQLDLKHPKSS